MVTGTREDGTQFDLEWKDTSHTEMERQAAAQGAVKTEYKELIWEEVPLSYYGDEENKKFIAIDEQGNQKEISPAEMAYCQMMMAVNSGQI